MTLLSMHCSVFLPISGFLFTHCIVVFFLSPVTSALNAACFCVRVLFGHCGGTCTEVCFLFCIRVQHHMELLIRSRCESCGPIGQGFLEVFTAVDPAGTVWTDRNNKISLSQQEKVYSKISTMEAFIVCNHEQAYIGYILKLGQQANANNTTEIKCSLNGTSKLFVVCLHERPWMFCNPFCITSCT